jgi:hypothetical protein
MEGESLTCTLCNDTFIRSECIASNISIRIWAEVAVAYVASRDFSDGIEENHGTPR